jgi:hypothetical protein
MLMPKCFQQFCISLQMAADSEKAEPLDLENQEFLPDENTNALM